MKNNPGPDTNEQNKNFKSTNTEQIESKIQDNVDNDAAMDEENGDGEVQGGHIEPTLDMEDGKNEMQKCKESNVRERENCIKEAFSNKPRSTPAGIAVDISNKRHTFKSSL